MLLIHDESSCWYTSSRSKLWYIAFVPMRNAYFRVKCTAKGVSPFHRALTPSSLIIVSPQCQMPASHARQVQSYTGYTPLTLSSIYEQQYHTFVLAHMVKLQSGLDNINRLQTACLSSPSDGACTTHTVSNGATSHMTV